MTFTRMIGADQEKQWLEHSPEDARAISKCRDLLNKGKYSEARRLLSPLLEGGNAEAEFLAAGFSWGDESEQAFDHRFVRLISSSAQKGFAPAMYALGFLLDVGEIVAEDKARAADLFKRAAELGHAHSQWIYGTMLLYGSANIAKNEALGIQFISRAAEANFQGALESLAKFYESGKFGFDVDDKKARELRRRARSSKAITY